jgi:hypothetical protein
MKRLLAALLLPLFAGASLAQAPSATAVLSKDTEIRLKMAQTVTSKGAYLGERVELVVADDVNVGNDLVIPRSTRVLGTVKLGKAKEGDRKNLHQVMIEVDYIRLGDRRIAVRGTQSAKGTLDKSTAIASTALFGLVGLSIAMDSRTGVIKEGTDVKTFVAEEVTLPVLGPASKVASSPTSAPTAAND